MKSSQSKSKNIRITPKCTSYPKLLKIQIPTQNAGEMSSASSNVTLLTDVLCRGIKYNTF